MGGCTLRFQPWSSCRTFVPCHFYEHILPNHKDETSCCLGHHPRCHGNGSHSKPFLSDILTLSWGDHRYRMAKLEECAHQDLKISKVILSEGLNGVNRQPSNGQKINRQPTNERAKISRQISFFIFC